MLTISFKLNFTFIYCVCMCMPQYTYKGQRATNRDKRLSFHHVGPGKQTQVFCFDRNTFLSPLRHLASPVFFVSFF